MRLEGQRVEAAAAEDGARPGRGAYLCSVHVGIGREKQRDDRLVTTERRKYEGRVAVPLQRGSMGKRG